MARALEPVAQSEILRRHPSLDFQDGGFQWRIVRDGERSLMTVSGKGETVTVPLLWAFGRGQAGQTYIFERDGVFYESRVSFYNALGGLDLTMGAQQSQAEEYRRRGRTPHGHHRRAGLLRLPLDRRGLRRPSASGIDRSRRGLRILPWRCRPARGGGARGKPCSG